MLAATDAGAFSEGIFNNIERDIRATTSEKFLTFLTVDFFVCGAAQFFQGPSPRMYAWVSRIRKCGQ